MRLIDLRERQQALILSPSTPVVVGPKFRLEVLNSELKPADHVTLDDSGFLEVLYADPLDALRSNGKEQILRFFISSCFIDGSSGLEVTDVFATDLHEKIQYPLYDHEG